MIAANRLALVCAQFAGDGLSHTLPEPSVAAIEMDRFQRANPAHTVG